MFDISTSIPLPQFITNQKQDLSIKDKTGKTIGYLDKKLIQKNNLSSFQISMIKELHLQLQLVYETMENTPSTDIKNLKKLFSLTTSIEYRKQMYYGVAEDRSQHNWFMVPKCTCPKKENQERQGTPFRIIDKTCPIHN